MASVCTTPSERSRKTSALILQAVQRDATQAAIAATDELFGLGYDHHDQFANRIDSVTLDDIRKLAAGRLKECVVTISTTEPDRVKIPKGERTYTSFPKVDLTPRGVQHDVGGGAK